MSGISSVVHYFAFGSNMNPERVRARGLTFTRIRGARLDGYELCFDKQSAAHAGSGHADLRWRRGAVAEGVLYTLTSPDEILRMDPFEHAPVNYSREVVRVAVDGGLEAAWTYFANPAVRIRGGRPSRDYLAHLLAGRPYVGADYHARLQAWPVSDPEPAA